MNKNTTDLFISVQTRLSSAKASHQNSRAVAEPPIPSRAFLRGPQRSGSSVTPREVDLLGSNNLLFKANSQTRSAKTTQNFPRTNLNCLIDMRAPVSYVCSRRPAETATDLFALLLAVSSQ